MTAIGGYGFFRAYRLGLERVRIRYAELPTILDGLKIGQITDIHAGPLVPEKLIKEGVDLIIAEKPDLIVLTGDFVSGATKFLHTSYGGFKERHLTFCMEQLGRLNARLGVYAVLGNHDFWSGKKVARRIAESLEGIGVTVLRNQSLSLIDGTLTIAGVDDYWEDTYDYKRTAESLNDDAFHLLLSHNPDVNDEIDIHDASIDLILSGHTHGGQIVLPLVGAPFIPSKFRQKYRAGLVRDGDRYTYTSRGLGLFFVPIRLNCPAEVTLLTLSKG